MDQNAYDTLVKEYGDRVERVARSIRAYKQLGIPLCDLVQTGMVGLFQAAEKFNPTHGVAFWTYAEYRVRGCILNSLDELRHLPRRVYDRALDVTSADTTNVPPSDAHRLLRDLSAQLTAMIVLETEANRAELQMEIKSAEPSPEDVASLKSDTSTLWRFVERLPPRERTVIEQHDRMNIPFNEIAKSMHIDKSSVSRLHKRGCRQLRVLVAEWMQQDEDAADAARSSAPSSQAQTTDSL